MKKIIAIIVSAMLSFSMLSPAFAADFSPLTDAGLLTAQEASLPLDEPLTRGELAAMLNRAFKVYTTLGDGFTDAGPDTSYYYDMMAAKTDGYLAGYEDGLGHPEDTVTRAQAAVILDSLMGLSQPTEAPLFSDDAMIPQWAAESISRVVACGIMSAENGLFMPNEFFSRGDLYASFTAITESKEYLPRVDELMTIPSFDGYELEGRLSLPGNSDAIDRVIIFVDGTGPDTYEMKRADAASGLRFKFVDVFADEFTERGTALFSYNTRGVDISEDAPFYSIDSEKYQSYTPQNVAQDLTYMIEALKNRPELANAKVTLLGLSEGAMIAPLAVAEYGAQVDSLILWGYPNDNMKQILEYQLGGGMSLFNYGLFFNVPGADAITKEQFEADPNGILDIYLPGVTFEQVDLDSDGAITIDDFSVMMEPISTGLFDAVERGDDQWIIDNMSPIMPQLCCNWFSEHFKLPKNDEIMLKVDIPIYMYHGTYDANCPVQGAYDVQQRFEDAGKTNLSLHVYDGLDHDLHFSQWLLGYGSQAIDDIFELANNIVD